MKNIFKTKGSVTCFCPNCLEMKTFKNLKIKTESDIGATIYQPDDHIFHTLFTFTCPSCGSEMAALDEGMQTAIPTLNEKGYITLNCCAGHQEGACGMSLPYIQFSDMVRFPEAHNSTLSMIVYDSMREYLTKDEEAAAIMSVEMLNSRCSIILNADAVDKCNYAIEYTF